MSKIADLLPCPFCGGTADFSETNAWWVTCNECNAETEADMSPEGAAEYWNKRTPPPHTHVGGEPDLNPAHSLSSAHKFEKLDSDDCESSEIGNTDSVELDRDYDHSHGLLRRIGDGVNVGEKRNVRSKQSPGLSRTGNRVSETGSTTPVEYSTRGLSSAEDKYLTPDFKAEAEGSTE